MLVKIPDADDAAVDALKAATGKNTGSKAYAYAALMYSRHVMTIALLQAEKSQLEQQLAVAEQVIQRARSAAASLLEHTSQGDLLDGH